MIGIALHEPAVAAGGFLTATVRWIADGDRQPRRIIVAAEWQTDGAGDPVRGVGRSAVFQPKEREEVFGVRFLIPHEGPLSYDGELLKIVWKLRVRVDRFGVDEIEEVLFRVEPRPVHRGQSQPNVPAASSA